MNKIVSIPNPKTLKENELVLIPKKEYEELLMRPLKLIPTVKPTKAELRAIERGRREFREGNYITLDELERELARPRSTRRKKTT